MKELGLKSRVIQRQPMRIILQTKYIRKNESVKRKARVEKDTAEWSWGDAKEKGWEQNTRWYAEYELGSKDDMLRQKYMEIYIE